MKNNQLVIYWNIRKESEHTASTLNIPRNGLGSRLGTRSYARYRTAQQDILVVTISQTTRMGVKHGILTHA